MWEPRLASIGNSSKEDLRRHSADNEGEELAWTPQAVQTRRIHVEHGADGKGEKLAWAACSRRQIHADHGANGDGEKLAWTLHAVRARQIHTGHGAADE